MENNVNEYEEVNLKEIISILWKNRYFIVSFLVAGLLLGLIFSGIKMIQNPVVYRYQAKATLELVDGAEMINQPQTMLHVMESKSILDDASGKLMINNLDYKVTTEASSKPNQYDVVVEGPDRVQVVNLVNEIVAHGRTVASPSMTMSSNTVIENGHLFGSPIEISNDVNFTSNTIKSLIFAGILSIFLVFAIRFMNGKIYSKDDVEKVLGTKVMASIPIDDKKNIYKRFLKVR